MKRYAFIDVQNTETTTVKLLHFSIDYERVFLYLRDKWKCEEVFFYPGIEHNDSERKETFSVLAELGAIIRPKYFFKYKNKDKILNTRCSNCNAEIIKRINTGYSWKCNCDVELTIDLLDHTREVVEIFLFSGDGDFEFLINKAIERNCKVAIVSSAQKVQTDFRYATSRLSTKLRKLTQTHGTQVRFIEINNLKFKFQTEQ